MNRNAIIFFALLLAWLGYNSFYVIEEGEMAIVTRLGKFKTDRRAPGAFLKVPLVDTVTKMQKRILGSDTPKAEYLTLDKKRLVADPITRWRVSDPIRFFKAVGNETGAKPRIDDIVNSALRDEIASHNFGDIIGGTRQPMMIRVAEAARVKVEKYGIHLVDVQIKRADLPQEVERSVFARMEAERARVAKRYRAEGGEEAAKIKAQADKEVEIKLAEAYKEAQELRGAGDAESVAIYADSFGKDSEFYSFTRSLEAYEVAIDEKTTMVLSTDSDLLRYVSAPQ